MKATKKHRNRYERKLRNCWRSAILNKYSLLLFDLDDTLLINSSWFDDGLIHSLAMHPLTREIDELLFLKKIKQPPKHLIKKLVERELSPSDFKKERWQQALDCFDLKVESETIDELEELFLNTSMDFITVHEPVRALINDLSKHYELGIVTTDSMTPNKNSKIWVWGKYLALNKVFHAEKIGFRKPDSRIYFAALDYFNKKPDETIFIGDSWTHDVIGPLDAGMKSIWVNGRKVEQPSKHHPMAMVTEITEIRDLLLSGNSN